MECFCYTEAFKSPRAVDCQVLCRAKNRKKYTSFFSRFSALKTKKWAPGQPGKPSRSPYYLIFCDVCPCAVRHTSLPKATSYPQGASFAEGKHHSKKPLLSIDKRDFFVGPPEGIRTPVLQNRNLLRYPAAPRAEILSTGIARAFFLLFGISFWISALPTPCIFAHFVNT